MSVTTANTIRFSDVCLEQYGNSSTSGRTLITAFADASLSGFNLTYSTGFDSLLAFRGYTNPPPNPLTPTNLEKQSGPFAGDIIAGWDMMANATSYNVYIGGGFYVNTEENSVLIDSFECVEVSVSSVNGGYESTISDPVEMCAF